ncbi:hypothetical protein EQV77_01905 [Halobacillus fulvus]|nr:hypothetical protein EQV77_01905 [Halobacillus fulvus]
MKQTIRSFAVGLFTSSLILGVAFYLEEPEETTSQELTPEEMKETIEGQGYYVLEQDQYDSLLNLKDQDQEPEKEEGKAQETFIYTLDIVSGTTTPDIADRLESAGIIENGQEFEEVMEDGDYSRFIQLGEATVSSKMNLTEIAEAITSK